MDDTLKRAEELLAEFEAHLDPSALENAWRELRPSVVNQDTSHERNGQLRVRALDLWLRMVDLLDRLYDPTFNHEEPPSRFVLPPDGPGVPPHKGAIPPDQISNPTLRAEYERAIAENKAKIKRWRFQTSLQDLAGQAPQTDRNYGIPADAKRFIRHAYASTPTDRMELKSLIERRITGSERKAELLKVHR